MLPLVGGIFAGHYYILVGADELITSALAASLSYMVTGAYLLGIVQMLVFLNASGVGRVAQNAALWVWASAVAAAFYLMLRHFTRRGEGEGGEDNRSNRTFQGGVYFSHTTTS